MGGGARTGDDAAGPGNGEAQTSEAPSGLAAEEAAGEAEQAAEEVAAGTHRDEASEVRGATDRTAAPMEGVRGRVEDARGGGIPGVVVSWTPLRPDWIGEDVAWSNQKWQEIGEASVKATTGPDGRYELPALPAGASSEESAIWATKPGFSAKSSIVDSSSRDRDLLIALEPAEALQVIVLSESGSRVKGATVDHFADYDRDPRGPEAESLEKRAQLILRRAPVTRADGSVLLPIYPDHCVVQARKDGLVSDAVWAPEERVLTLTLGGTFSAIGSVHLAHGVPAETPLVVDCRALKADRLHHLARANVGGEGRWSIPTIPLLAIDSYVFRLTGEGVALDEEHRGIPSAGDVVEVELEARPGEEIAVHAVDDLGQDLAGANVAVYWLIDDVIHAIDLTTDPKGMCRTDECVPTDIWLWATAEGHLPSQEGPINLPAPELGPVEVVLQKTGMIRGRVLHLGQPVRAFEVAWMSAGEDPTPVGQYVSDSEEGTFEFTDVPPGEVSLMASAEGLAQSDLVPATVGRYEPAEVALELPEGLRGHGRVVSAGDRQPISGATILLYTCHMGQTLWPRGTRYASGPEGEFTISGLNPGINYAHVQAEGFAESFLEGFATAGEELDLGEVALSRAQRLTVQLISGEPTDFSTCSLSASGPGMIDERHFSTAGEVVCEGVAPGDWNILIDDPRGFSQRITKRLIPGRDWTVHVYVQGGGEFQVEVLPEPQGTLPDKCILLARYLTQENGKVEWTAFVPPDGKLSMPRFPADSAALTVFTPNWLVLGSASVSLKSATGQTIRIQLGGHPLSVQVIDELGEPLAGARVSVTSVHADGRWARGMATGADGVAEIGKVPYEEILVHLLHPVQGTRVGVRIRPAELPEGRAILELNGDIRIEIPLRDGEEPCANVRAGLSDPTTIFSVGECTSDAGGNLGFSGLSEGPHLLVLDDPRYWRSEHIVEVSKSTSPKPIEIRRLGGLSIEVLDAAGVPVGGLPVELVSLEFGASVAQWLSQGLVLCGENGLTTDLSGRIHLDGLPRGAYSWRVAAGSASGLGGEVTVPGGETGGLTVRLP